MSVSKIIQTLLAIKSLKAHYGQWSEDVLVRKLFPRGKKTGVYLDLGAYHPFRHSNTAHFWQLGWHGYNIDANPHTIELYKKTRPQDQNIWTAIIPDSEYRKDVHEIDLMLPDASAKGEGVSAVGTVNIDYVSGRELNSRIRVPAISVNGLLEKYGIREVDYLNVDIEGFDEAIIQEFDFKLCHPKVISVEDFGPNMEAILASPISTTLRANGYQLMNRAGSTSIFVSSNMNV